MRNGLMVSETPGPSSMTFTDTIGSTPTTPGPATVTNDIATYSYNRADTWSPKHRKLALFGQGLI
jgi:hypothetical protein